MNWSDCVRISVFVGRGCSGQDFVFMQSYHL
jgi:hypothetical protein